MAGLAQLYSHAPAVCEPDDVARAACTPHISDCMGAEALQKGLQWGGGRDWSLFGYSKWSMALLTLINLTQLFVHAVLCQR
jgi:hypothetical protein